MKSPGIHHVTAIAGDPQKNLNFYTGLIGLKLVKLTVNYDDPKMYHLYYGDGAGTPGTLLTFVHWPEARRGRQGTGQASSIAFAVRPLSLGYWIQRLLEHGVKYEGPTTRFGEQVLSFRDPDNLQVELVTHQASEAWNTTPVSALSNEHELRGIHSVTLWEVGCEQTAQLLTQQLGFYAAEEENNVFRYKAGDDAPGPGPIVDLRCAPGFWEGVVAVGTIHHVAFQTHNEETQLALRKQLVGQDVNVTPVIDRYYFHSIYFREPGGVLFEIARPPTFTVDEPLDELGMHLKLPPWLEDNRQELERVLPPLNLPATKGASAWDIDPEVGT